MSGAMNYLLSPGAGVKAGRSWTASLTLSSNRHCHLSSSCNEAENHRKHLYRGFREEPLPSAQNRQLCWSSVLHCQDAATQCGDRKGDSTYGARKVGLGRKDGKQQVTILCRETTHIFEDHQQAILLQAKQSLSL
ncbi:uncharacterized protein [Macaca nemestrina]|uniref:uncharacterized protein isoform X3 n=1 Tax=Macaca nemestrina TaxID=9545 RepID=UPI0039B8914E